MAEERADQGRMAAFLKDAAAGAAALGGNRGPAAMELPEKDSSPREGGAGGNGAAGEQLGGLEEELRFLSLELVAVGRNMEQASPPSSPRHLHPIGGSLL